MARLAANSSSRRESTVDSLYRTPSIPPSPQPDPQPSPSGSSDKENKQSHRAAITAGKQNALAAPNSRGPKRRRLQDRDGSVQYESSSAGSGDEEGSADEEEGAQHGAHPGVDHQANIEHRYDPHQPLEERRELRKNYRELDKEMQDSRTEWMAANSTGLQEAIVRQNVLFGSVKQTSEATMDSQMLVSAGDLAHKRTRRLNVSDNAQGIDLDEFVGKCISFMNPDGIQQEEEDEQEVTENQGNALDWSFLGTHACFPYNVRPPTIGFLLGPLAAQKRVRQPTQRKARAKNARDNTEVVKARELKASDLQSQENTGLTQICLNVMSQFVDAQEDGVNLVSDFWEKKDRGQTTPEQEQDFDKYIWLMPDGGVNFFKFVIHPTDFGQSAENLFYIAFLIRDDHVKIIFDKDSGLPSLRE